MDAQPDAELLRAYAERGADAAFAELVRRHLDLVHSAARRMVGDAHLAEDVTQTTFLALAQNAAQLTDRPVLAGWLHRTAQNIAAQTVRTDARRRVREQEAAAMNEPCASTPEADWAQIAPHLDAALGELTEADRDAVMLRYFQRQSAREMAQTLGISDEAAQKRVSRAVERLREFLAKRGVTVGAGGLAVIISTHAVQAAPVGLALTITTAAATLTGTTLATTATVTKALAMTTLQKTIVTATIAVLAGVGIYEARQASQLREQNQSLQQRQASLTEQIQQLESKNKERASQRTVADGSQNETNNLKELLRLRGEVARLRREADELSTKANEALAFQAKFYDVFSNTPPVRTFVATSSLSVPWDQTIGLGGWKTPSGKRAFVLATVERGGTAQQVSIRSQVIEYTEAGGSELGLAGFNHDVTQPSAPLRLDAKQTDDLLARARNSQEASLTGGLSVITASGQPAQIQAAEILSTPSGEKYNLGPRLDVVPIVSADGESVQVVMTTELNYRIPLPTP